VALGGKGVKGRFPEVCKQLGIQREERTITGGRHEGTGAWILQMALVQAAGSWQKGERTLNASRGGLSPVSKKKNCPFSRTSGKLQCDEIWDNPNYLRQRLGRPSFVSQKKKRSY